MSGVEKLREGIELWLAPELKRNLHRVLVEPLAKELAEHLTSPGSPVYQPTDEPTYTFPPEWLDEDTLAGLATALHVVNLKARHVYNGLEQIEVRGRSFALAWDDDTHNYVVTGEVPS